MILVLCLLSAAVSIAEPATLYPTDDADVWQFQPDSCLGSAQSFQVGFFAQYRRNSLIKFDLTPYFGETVNSATLRLYVLSSYGEFPADGILYPGTMPPGMNYRLPGAADPVKPTVAR